MSVKINDLNASEAVFTDDNKMLVSQPLSVALPDALAGLDVSAHSFSSAVQLVEVLDTTATVTPTCGVINIEYTGDFGTRITLADGALPIGTLIAIFGTGTAAPEIVDYDSTHVAVWTNWWFWLKQSDGHWHALNTLISCVSGDPHVAGRLYYDPDTGIVKRSAGS
jgi:hypothetical protein